MPCPCCVLRVRRRVCGARGLPGHGTVTIYFFDEVTAGNREHVGVRQTFASSLPHLFTLHSIHQQNERIYDTREKEGAIFAPCRTSQEEDEGKLLAHKAFWQYPDAVRRNSTITELIFVPNEIKDKVYLLNIQIASFEIDVSPSKPVLYEINGI